MMGGMSPVSDAERDLEYVLPEPLLEFPSFLLVELAREARRIGLRVHEDDLRIPHVTALACLDEFGPAAQKDISRRLRIDASDLVSLLDELEERGLVTRRRDERDRRRYVVTITAAGGRALRSRLVTVRKQNDILLAPLDSQERLRLHEMLVRVYHHHDPNRVGDGFLARIRQTTA
jgi:DNA-binding MarR family transcriptional regulator